MKEKMQIINKKITFFIAALFVFGLSCNLADAAQCGNRICETGETIITCPGDCATYSCVLLDGEWGAHGFRKCTFASGSTGEWPILTRYNSSTDQYDPYGRDADPHCPFPDCDAVVDYNQYAFEITADYVPTQDKVKNLIGYVESLGYRVDLYNDVSRVITDGSNPHVQIVNNFRTGTGTSTVGNTQNGLFYFIFPPNFNKTTDSLPILVGNLGTSHTPTRAVYGCDTPPELMLRLITVSKEDARTGIIGVIPMSGGQGSQSYDEESLDAFAEAISFLKDNFNADNHKLAMFGGSRGGGSSLIRAANPRNHDYTAIAVFASAAPVAIGSHSQLKSANSLTLDLYYPSLHGWLYYPDYARARDAWKYNSQYPPHTGPAYIARFVVGTTDVTEADSRSAIGYADYQHFGGKYLVLAFGTHDSTIPYHISIKFDEALRNAGIPHKTCVVLKGGHGEMGKCIDEELEHYILDYLTKGIEPELANGRYYYHSNLSDHNAQAIMYLGSETEGMELPFTTTIPVGLDSSIDFAGYNNIYINKQQPADIILVGTKGKTFKVQLLDNNHNFLQEWSGVFGEKTTGDEYHIIQNVQFDCPATCIYYWKFWYDGKEISSYNTPFLDTSGNPREAFTGLVTSQPYIIDIETYLGNSGYRLNMGLTSLPTCGNHVCEAWENQLTCPADCDATAPTTPVVTDEGDFTNKPDQLYASWASSDPESDIYEYQYKITQDSIAGPIVREWTSTGTTNYVSAGELSLIDSKTYYFSVKAKNGALLESNVGYSDGITVDATAPTVSILSPADGETLSGTTIVTANASDNVALAGVQFKLDGANLGSEVFTAPYAVSWDTSKISDGPHTLTAIARDTAGNSTTASTVTAVVSNASNPANNPPVLSPIGNKSINEGVTLSFTLSATDLDNDALTYSASGLPSGATFNALTKQFSWIPGFDQAGNYNLSFSVNDGNGGSDTETVTITVNNVVNEPSIEVTVDASQASAMPEVFKPRFFPWYFNSAESYPMQKITNDGLAKYIYGVDATVSWNVYNNPDTTSLDETISKMKQYSNDLKLNTWFSNNHINFVIGIAQMPRWLSSDPTNNNPIIPGSSESLGLTPIWRQSPPKCYDFECNGEKGWASLVKEVVHYFNVELGLNAPLNIWHEPSWNWFYGTEADYYQLYKYAVIGAKAADPNIKIAGPAPVTLARKEKLDLSGYESPNSMMQDFIEYAGTHRLDYDNDTENIHLHYDKWPIDIISFSALDQYGNTWKNIADLTKGWLTSKGYSADTPMFAQEFGTWVFNGTDYLDPNRDKEYIASYAINQLGWLDKAAINYYYFTTFFDYHNYDSYPQVATQEFIGTNDPWTSNYVIKSVYNAFKALSILNGNPEGELSNRVQATFNDNDFITAVASQTKDKSKTRMLLSNFIPSSAGMKTQYMFGIYGSDLLSKGYTITDAYSIMKTLFATYQNNPPTGGITLNYLTQIINQANFSPLDNNQVRLDLIDCSPQVVQKLADLTYYTTNLRQVDFSISGLPFSGAATLTTYTIDKDNSNACKCNKATEETPTDTECGVNGIIDRDVNQAKTDAVNAAADYFLSIGYSQSQVNAFANCALTPGCIGQTLVDNYCQQYPSLCDKLKADIAEATKVKNGVFYYGGYTDSNGHNYSSPIYIDKINSDTELFKAYTNITVPLEGSKQVTEITVNNGTYEGIISMQPYSVVLLEISSGAVDTTLPVTQDSGIDGLWHKSPVTVTLTASDSGSGINKTYYSIDGSNPATLYSGPFTISSSGSYTIKYYSVDKAGNAELVKTAANQVKIDISAPTVSILSPADAGTVSGTTIVTADASDNIALAGVQFKLDGANLGSEVLTAPYAVSWDTTTATQGNHTITAVVRDSVGNNATSSPVNVVVFNNHVPVLAAIGDKTVAEGSNLGFTLSATDADDDDTLTYSVGNLPTGAGFNASSKTFSWTPGFDQAGTYNVSFSVEDANGASASESITITVSNTNRAPVLAAIGNKTTAEASLLSFTISATDADLDSLTYSAGNLPTGAGFNASTKTFNWTPNYSQASTYNVTFSVSDANGGVASEAITITVNNANRAPVLGSIGNKSVNENSNLSFTVSATDADLDSLTYSAGNLPTGAGFNASSKTFSWTPSYSQAGSYNISFSVDDGNSGTSSESITITVSNINRAPVLTSIGNKTTAEASLLSFTISATDADEDSLTYSAANLPNGAGFNASSKTFSWTPSYSHAGSYNISFSVDDGSLSDSETITITVNNLEETSTDFQTDTAADTADTVAETDTAAETATDTELSAAEVTPTVNINTEDNNSIIAGSAINSGAVTEKGDSAQPESGATKDQPETTMLAAPIVSDEGDYTENINILSATWFSSSGSDIPEYQYRITRDSPVEGEVVIDWTSTGSDNYAKLDGLRLDKDKKYYFNVKAKDKRGAWSKIGYSDGIMVINVPSSAELTALPANKSTVNKPIELPAVYSDPNGWQDIEVAMLAVNSGIGKNILARYNPDTNKIYLRDDANKEWIGGFAPGSKRIIENSYAKLDCSKITLSEEGQTLSINWNISFKEKFKGAKRVYLRAMDNSKADSGWLKKGTLVIK